MFHKYYSDQEGNRYFLYDFNGAPERMIQVKPKTIARRCRRQLLSQLISECVTPQMKQILTDVLNQNLAVEYDLHHIHPLGFGGNNKFNNLCLIPTPLHQKLHSFLQIERYAPWIKDIATKLEQKNRKVFINVPELPFIVTQKDMPFLSQPPKHITRARLDYMRHTQGRSR